MLQTAYQNNLLFRTEARNETKATEVLDKACALSSISPVSSMRAEGTLQASAGASAAFVALYTNYRSLVYARCRRLLDEVDDAEDATQEVFIRALNHLTSLPGGVDAARWLYRTATNYCFNVIRDRKLRGKRIDELRGDATDSGGHAEETAIRRDAVRRVLAAVSPMQRMVVVLHYVDEMDQHEVAHTLQISRRTVVNRLAELNRDMSPRLRDLA